MAKKTKKLTDRYKSSLKGFKTVSPEKYDMEMPAHEYPTIRLSIADIPEAKDWEVGKRYTIEAEVEQTMMSQRAGKDGKVEFTIIGVKPGKKVKN